MNIRRYDEWDSSRTGRRIKPKPFNPKMSQNNVHGNKNKFEDKMNLAGHGFTIMKKKNSALILLRPSQIKAESHQKENKNE